MGRSNKKTLGEYMTNDVRVKAFKKFIKKYGLPAYDKFLINGK